MAFQTTLPSGERLTIENSDGQTHLTFESGGANQRRSQRSGFQSGTWTHPPTLFQSPGGLILRIEAEQNHYLALEGHAMRHLGAAPDLRAAQALPLEQLQVAPTTHPLPPLQPMAPMKPMRPLEPMKPMEMRLGSMHMSMGDARETPPQTAEASRATFCTQCGQRAQDGDKFCARCGQELRSL